MAGFYSATPQHNAAAHLDYFCTGGYTTGLAGSPKAGRELYWAWFNGWGHPLKRKLTNRVKVQTAQRFTLSDQRNIIETKAQILPARTVAALRRKSSVISVPIELIQHDAAVKFLAMYIKNLAESRAILARMRVAA